MEQGVASRTQKSESVDIGGATLLPIHGVVDVAAPRGCPAVDAASVADREDEFLLGAGESAAPAKPQRPAGPIEQRTEPSGVGPQRGQDGCRYRPGIDQLAAAVWIGPTDDPDVCHNHHVGSNQSSSNGPSRGPPIGRAGGVAVVRMRAWGPQDPGHGIAAALCRTAHIIWFASTAAIRAPQLVGSCVELGADTGSGDRIEDCVQHEHPVVPSEP